MDRDRNRRALEVRRVSRLISKALFLPENLSSSSGLQLWYSPD
ncbi:hypothetical protein CLOM621_06619 [Clostridium sp. M62/1]|nr:hypothetical protein CLOM621_06619 [Clostridium sp. M62/1]